MNTKPKEAQHLIMDVLISHLVEKSINIPSLTFISGLAGESSQSRWLRIYNGSGLLNWVEYHETDVVYTTEISAGIANTEWTFVWLRREAKLIRGKIELVQAQSAFLQGEIQSQRKIFSNILIELLDWNNQNRTAHSCYELCQTGITLCNIILCTLPGNGCPVSRAPDVCV